MKKKILSILLMFFGTLVGVFYQLNDNQRKVKAEEAIDVYSSGTISLPITGSIYAYSSETIPSGYLKCNGQAVSRTTYNALYNIIGTTYGSGDGSTTFNLPNLNGRIVIGKNSTYTIGKTGGEASVTLNSTSYLPSHTHSVSLTNSASVSGNNSAGQSATWSPGISYTSSGGDHGHNFASVTGTDFTVGSGTGGGGSGIKMVVTGQGGCGGNIGTAHWFSHSGNGNGVYGSSANGNHIHTATPTGTVAVSNTSHTHSIKPNGSNSNTGGNGAHNNMQPYTVVNYIIKY